MAATPFKMIRPRRWTNGAYTVILPCDKKTFRLYAGAEIFGVAPLGTFRTRKAAFAAANRGLGA